MSTEISRDLTDRILTRLGLSRTPAADLDGLRSAYAAWCLGVPFDNIAKVIALRTAPHQPLPGIDATEFFERWLAYGVGGTCWSTSNALCELLLSLGFNARRVAGSMGDTGYIGHGSVKVRIDNTDWLADSSMLTDIPIPLTDKVFISDNKIFGCESEPADETHVVWADLLPVPNLTPCRLLVDPTDHAYYVERFEASRARSPFNDHLFIRRNGESDRCVIVGNRRTWKSADGTESRELNPAELCATLIDEFGVSKEFVDEWRACGALEASFAPLATPPQQTVTPIPPSRRLNRRYTT